MAEYFHALFTAIFYGFGVLVGMTIISFGLVSLGGGAKGATVHHDDDHGHAPKPAAAPVPAPAPVAEPAPEAPAPEDKPEE